MSELEKYELKLEAIFRTTNNKTFSLTESTEIVGGESRFWDLVGKGMIRAEKSGNRQNARWRCNASDVLRHASVGYELKTKRHEKNNNKRVSA